MYDWYSVQIPSANAHAELRTVMLSPMHFGWPQTRPRLYTLGIRKGAKVMLQTHPCAAIAGDWNLQNPLNKVIDLWATPNFEAAEFFAANKDGCERTHLHTTITRRQKPTGLQALRPSCGLSFNNFDLNSRLPTQLNPNSSPWPSPVVRVRCRSRWKQSAALPPQGHTKIPIPALKCYLQDCLGLR